MSRKKLHQDQIEAIKVIAVLDPKQHPWKYKAIRNLRVCKMNTEWTYIKNVINNPIVLAINVFLWIHTFEGYAFWNDVQYSLITEEEIVKT